MLKIVFYYKFYLYKRKHLCVQYAWIKIIINYKVIAVYILNLLFSVLFMRKMIIRMKFLQIYLIIIHNF